MASAATAACPVTNFTDRSLSSLTEIQRLAFVSQITRTEFASLKRAAPGDKNYYPLIVNSTGLGEARKAADARIAALHIDNSADYAKFWAADYLTDAQMQKWVTCTSKLYPGLMFGGRPGGPGGFSFTFVHLAPIGTEKIRIRLVASHNVANADQFENFLKSLGEQDNFTAQTFPLHLSHAGEPAVLVIRAGWETPNLIYIPAYPTPQVRSE
jgi:hypothetical protein